MTKPFGYYGITEITAINLEKIHGPALQELPAVQRCIIAAAILAQDQSHECIAAYGYTHQVTTVLGCLSDDQRISAAKAIINTL